MYTFSFLVMETSDKVAQHVSAMGIIFVISLLGMFSPWNASTLRLILPLAVAFPALSKKIRFLSIPKILFFIGKHFGTGQIVL